MEKNTKIKHHFYTNVDSEEVCYVYRKKIHSWVQNFDPGFTPKLIYLGAYVTIRSSVEVVMFEYDTNVQAKYTISLYFLQK